MSSTIQALLADFPSTMAQFSQAFSENPEAQWNKLTIALTLAQEIARDLTSTKSELDQVKREVLSFRSQPSFPATSTPNNERIPAVQPQVMPTVPKLHVSEKLPHPAEFSGDKKDLRRFVNQVQNKMVANADRYTTPVERNAYVMSRLQGEAHSMILPYASQGTIQLPDYTSILAILERAYGDPNLAANARRALLRLRQGDQPFSVFYADFQRLSIDSEFPTAALETLLAENISRELKGMLLHSPIATKDVDVLATHLQDLENRMQQFSATPVAKQAPEFTIVNSTRRPTPPMTYARAASPIYAPSSSPQTPSAMAKGDPMDLSRHNRSVGYRVPDEERQRRVKLNLCFRCGGDHVRANCPLSRATSPRQSITTLRTASPRPSPPSSPVLTSRVKTSSPPPSLRTSSPQSSSRVPLHRSGKGNPSQRASREGR